ncbi:hypothetical protein M378DRAFT_167220 [Amanita muscaria Koide BX008]|uniref:Uncharacterized protein n=1 Tax=Amanita muscaria (strain Koide BX008) TaxID=946122 RepID=A0A0C2SDU7_AMAMK|nr:hypothetical protein M378DRAFT_167220 [Amanita muscaria Koide BX008]
MLVCLFLEKQPIQLFATLASLGSRELAPSSEGPQSDGKVPSWPSSQLRIWHGPALRALRYLEERLKLGTLVSDSTNDRRAIVQLVIEVKRHPSQPSLAGWCAAIGEGSRSIARNVIANRSHPPTYRCGEFSTLPRDVNAWLGPKKEQPNGGQVCAVSPNKYAEGMGRKKRVLEDLSVAPNAFGTEMVYAAELALQEENDQRTIALLKIGLVLYRLS